MTEQELPLLSAPRASSVIYVENRAQLDAAVSELANGSGPFALDAERASGFKYSQRAYLIQVHRSGTPIYLIDPIAISDEGGIAAFASLSVLLHSEEWILHAASQDIPCLNELGIRPSKLFDTELGSRIAGLPRVGLGAVTEHFLQIRLAKEHSAVDWSTRPLPTDWLNYAALDVDVLVELRNAVETLLNQQGKLHWAKEEFAAVVDAKPKAPKLDRWRGITGIHEIKEAKQLAVVRALWIARESLAEKLDVSPGRLIPDSSIIHASINVPRSRPELASMKLFSGRASRTYLDTWWQAIADAKASRDLPPVKVQSTEQPHHRTWAKRFPDADRRLKFVRAALNSKAADLSIPVENLLTPDFARGLCWAPPIELKQEVIATTLKQFGARAWQIEQTSELLLESLILAADPDATLELETKSEETD